MDDLRGRFQRLDRITAPNLWNEAVGRAAELPMPRRWTVSPAMGLLAAALLLAALAGTVAVGAWLDQTPEPQETVTYDNGIIAGNGLCGGVLTVDPSSLEQREFAEAPDCEFGGWVGRPAWSSDGSRLAWIAEGDGTTSLWLYESNSGETREIVECMARSCDQLDISPDGSLVAYSATLYDGLPGLVVVDVASGETDEIELTGQVLSPAFSPDGRRIALSQLGGRSGIYLIDVGPPGDTSPGTPRLLGDIVDADHLTWSPDGKWIAYRHFGRMTGDGQVPLTAGLAPAGYGIVVTRVDGSDTRVLATGPANDGPQMPTWAPDSESLAYATIDVVEQRDGWGLELWTVNIDGSAPTSIFESGCCKEGFGAPSWSPDGEWIAFGLAMVDGPSPTGTYMIRPDGSDLKRVSDVPMEPVWQPIPKD